MSETTYEGWSNKPTWAVNLWLVNEEPLYRQKEAMVREVLEMAPKAELDDPKAVAAWRERRMADSIEEWVEEMLPDLGATFASDLLTWAVAHVNWLEIARTWLDDEIEARERAAKSR